MVSAPEWQTRLDLAACYRLVDKYDMQDLIYNHITARIPGTPDHLLINLYGLLYKEITASSLVKIDLDGNILHKPDTDYGINKSGYVIHGAIHRARPELACVLHTHTRAGMAVSAMRCGLLPLSSPTAIRFHRPTSAIHDYEVGPAVDIDERARLVADLGPHDAMIMRNHGLLTCGATIQQAFNTMYQLELSCRSQVDAMAARNEALHAGGERAQAAPRISTSPAPAAPTGCWNGPRCCGSWKPRARLRAIRPIGFERAAILRRPRAPVRQTLQQSTLMERQNAGRGFPRARQSGEGAHAGRRGLARHDRPAGALGRRGPHRQIDRA